jgi:hypothetical protein
MEPQARPASKEAAMARPLSQTRRWRRLAWLLPLLLLAACGGKPMPGAKPPPPGWVSMAQYEPAAPPRSMAPPPPPARPPSPGSTDFGHWQQEGNYFKWTPGQHLGPTPGPIWVPGHWANDASGNKVWSPGYWR